MVEPSHTTVVYTERLTPSPLTWLLAPGMGVIILVMFLPVSTATAIIIGLVGMAVTIGWLWSFAAKIEVTTTHLIVGRARIELSALGKAHACDVTQIRHYMGPGSDARSFVMTRPWIKSGIYVEQVDPRDPTPYWLFSTRYPQELLTHLEQDH